MHEFRLQIVNKTAWCGWMVDIFELRGLHRNWIGNAWGHLLLFVGYPHMRMSGSDLCQYEFIEYHPFPFWTQWLMTLLRDNELICCPQWRLTVKNRIRFGVLKIVECIGTSCSISYVGLGTIR